ncbi:MAG TPA: IPT/TIG domain-containing protein [Acidimicrobiales bacterium]|nr:IPT/TIG domain-containing protein [Acidimicrobiales bacterium]
MPAALLVMAGTLSSCLGWFTQLSTADGSAFTGISCPSTTVCFAVGSTASGQTILQRSTDAGASWTSLSSAASGETLTAISCPDVEHCLAVGGTGDALATTDGGHDWGKLNLPSSAPNQLSSVSCLDSNHCWVAIAPTFMISGSDTVDVTTDGGTTWTSSATIAPPGAVGFSLGLSSIACPTLIECVGVGNYWIHIGVGDDDYQPIVATSDDGGMTWQTQDPPAAADYLNGMSCLSADACVSLSNDSVVKIVTTDGGSTWSTSSVPVSDLSGDYLAAVSCSDSEHCVGVGGSANEHDLFDGIPGAFTNTPVIATSDGGNSWSVQYTDLSDTYPPDLNLTTVSCPTDSACWAAGETLPNAQGQGSTGSIIIHTLNGGAASPSVGSVGPSQGPTGGGTQVTISGSGFSRGVTSVAFGSATATHFTVDSDSQITATVPPSATDVSKESDTAVDVTVSTQLGTSPLNPDDLFTYIGLHEVVPDGAAAVASSAASASVTVNPTSPGDLLVAYIATYNGAAVSVSGGGLGWTNVLNQADAVAGDGGLISVWDAQEPSTFPVPATTVVSAITGNDGWDQTLDVVAYAGAAAVVAKGFTNGPNTSAPSLTVVPQASGSWIAVVGFDADSTTTVTPGAGQMLDGSFQDTTEDAQMWFQHDTVGTTALQDTTVGDTLSPAGKWDLGAVEILHQT